MMHNFISLHFGSSPRHCARISAAWWRMQSWISSMEAQIADWSVVSSVAWLSANFINPTQVHLFTPKDFEICEWFPLGSIIIGRRRIIAASAIIWKSLIGAGPTHIISDLMRFSSIRDITELLPIAKCLPLTAPASFAAEHFAIMSFLVLAEADFKSWEAGDGRVDFNLILFFCPSFTFIIEVLLAKATSSLRSQTMLRIT